MNNKGKIKKKNLNEFKMMGRKGNVKTVEQEERVKKYNSKALRQREMKAKKEGKRNVKK